MTNRVGPLALALVVLASSTPGALAQGARENTERKYPAIPVPLPDSEELALAMTAAPSEISARATVYAVKAGRIVVLRAGTNDCGCVVTRDLHPGSQYPICFDVEGTRTMLQRELMELRLRSLGTSEQDVEQQVAKAYDDGTLHHPERMAVAYMMSPMQVLFSTAYEGGARVGSWHPHLMIASPGISARGFGMAEPSAVGAFSVGSEG